MKMVMVRWAMLAAGAAIAGCHSTSVLNQRYVPARADLSDIQLPVPATGTPTATENPEPTDRQPLPVQQVITGTWTFTTPATVTRTLKKNGQIMQYALFAGRPAPTDLPIAVITVAPPAAPGQAQSQAEGDPATYKITGTRSYILNGNVAREWTGTTSTGSAFSELLLRRPGATDASDVCHAMATARTPAERKIALDVLGSLTWKPNEGQ